MGGGTYSSVNRMASKRQVLYSTQSIGETFKQSKERKAHKEMDSKDVSVREARDGEEGATFPIIFALDVTGSMGHIPHQMIKDGLPTLISGLIQKGIPRPALCFVAVGDHECDNYPLQIAQFESSDELLDHWLERVYLEGNGGVNMGESYMLPWYFAAHHTVTDHWEKRGKKGILVTIGDEPLLPRLHVKTMKGFMDHYALQEDVASEWLLAEAQEKWDVHHICLTGRASRNFSDWKQLLGDHCHMVSDHEDIPTVVQDICCNHGGCEINTETVNGLETTENTTVGEDTPTML